MFVGVGVAPVGVAVGVFVEGSVDDGVGVSDGVAVGPVGVDVGVFVGPCVGVEVGVRVGIGEPVTVNEPAWAGS